jgi:hypothetical protein
MPQREPPEAGHIQLSYALPFHNPLFNDHSFGWHAVIGYRPFRWRMGAEFWGPEFWLGRGLGIRQGGTSQEAEYAR